MPERRIHGPQARPTPPVGTVAYPSTLPSDVRVGDFLYLNGSFQRVQDMRTASTSGHRILHFAGRAPLIMRKALTVYRPLTPR
ncbi:hypothetical protein [Streptomyces sp. TBY4]|uniref:hypothetical protein n=1 Tax=Streptomyces sp. TBY4 TaxID=2962030 RepID=UPI0020B81CF2|nr:hypothetical protein [Streptomyces sp. TBY4]